MAGHAASAGWAGGCSVHGTDQPNAVLGAVVDIEHVSQFEFELFGIVNIMQRCRLYLRVGRHE